MYCKHQLASIAVRQLRAHRTFSDNAFRVFDLPLRFSLNEMELRSHYRTLMAQHHPDRTRHQQPVNDDNDRHEASTITRSYETLRHKHSRAMHLLELLGHAVDESSSGNLVGSGFLMEMMEAREDLEGITEDDQLQPLLLENKQRMEEIARQLDPAVQNSDFETAARLTAQLQYLNRLEETIREKMDTIE